jgi:hypothetical protein
VRSYDDCGGPIVCSAASEARPGSPPTLLPIRISPHPPARLHSPLSRLIALECIPLSQPPRQGRCQHAFLAVFLLATRPALQLSTIDIHPTLVGLQPYSRGAPSYSLLIPQTSTTVRPVRLQPERRRGRTAQCSAAQHSISVLLICSEVRVREGRSYLARIEQSLVAWPQASGQKQHRSSRQGPRPSPA